MNSRLRTSTLCLMATAALAIPIAGCGGDDNSSDSSDDSATTSQASGYGGGGGAGAADAGTDTAASGSAALSLAADPSGAIAFDKTSLEGKAGKNTLTFENASQVPHAVEIEGNGVEEETDTVVAGKATLSVDLKPGTYEFYCPIGDHAEEGMKGTLTVK